MPGFEGLVVEFIGCSGEFGEGDKSVANVRVADNIGIEDFT